MNSVKITYIIVQAIGEVFYLMLAVLAPIYITPNCYWWTVFFIIIFFLGSIGFTKRLNSWRDMGIVE